MLSLNRQEAAVCSNQGGADITRTAGLVWSGGVGEAGYTWVPWKLQGTQVKEAMSRDWDVGFDSRDTQAREGSGYLSFSHYTLLEESIQQLLR